MEVEVKAGEPTVLDFVLETDPNASNKSVRPQGKFTSSSVCLLIYLLPKFVSSFFPQYLICLL